MTDLKKAAMKDHAFDHVHGEAQEYCDWCQRFLAGANAALEMAAKLCEKECSDSWIPKMIRKMKVQG